MTTNETPNTVLIGVVTRYLNADGAQKHRHSYSRLNHPCYLPTTLRDLRTKIAGEMEKLGHSEFEIVAVRTLSGDYNILRPLWDLIYADRECLFHQKMTRLESESGFATEKIFDLGRDQITFTSWMHELTENENA